MLRRGIEDGGKFYWISDQHGPWVHKNSGNGRVLGRLQSAGRDLSLETIGKISGWQNPRRNMRPLAMMVDAWTDYEIEVTERRGTIYYGLRETVAA